MLGLEQLVYFAENHSGMHTSPLLYLFSPSFSSETNIFFSLFLSSLLFSSFVQQDIFRKIVNGQIARKEREYPVAVAGINITQKLYDILKINDEAGRMWKREKRRGEGREGGSARDGKKAERRDGRRGRELTIVF